MEFDTFNPNTTNPLLVYFKRIIKFLTLLCQDYNSFFVSIISKMKIDADTNLSQYCCLLLTSIIDKIGIYSRQKNLFEKFSNLLSTKHKFFNHYFQLFFAFFNEFIQSLVKESLDWEDKDFQLFYNKSIELIKTLNVTEIYEEYLFYFFKFLQSYTFEFGSNKDKEIEIKDILQALMHFYTRLYNKYIKNNTKGPADMDSSVLFIQASRENPTMFKEDRIFDIFSRFYIYINNKASISREGPCSKLLQNMRNYQLYLKSESNSNSNDNEKNQSNQFFILQREIYSVFSQVVKRVEVFISFKGFISEGKVKANFKPWAMSNGDNAIIDLTQSQIVKMCGNDTSKTIKEIFL